MAEGKDTALQAVIVNVKRLINDATILQEGGSTGSALSLAIMAFEEAGKGHILELGLEKPKNLHSHHIFRHQIAAFVMYASFLQKYEISTNQINQINQKIEKFLKDGNYETDHGKQLPAMSDALREGLVSDLLSQSQNISEDDLKILAIEARWLKKIIKTVDQGKLEKTRQSGLYLDYDKNFSITSTPETVQIIDADRWIWASTRVLNLLENGAYSQPYSPLSSLQTRANAGDEEAASTLKAMMEEAALNIE
ncbi:MAG: AbiV family abortive infection protein [Pseudomonadota bacterium]|nr:AbiV family abortive infection protein [Pseudomonadota bacterium]